ncbi:putative baseplate assembly protein [Achromobacter arsenitoxydans]|uniref:PA14 domain containing protein n=1 Tax=Achromobacter arsenitoxydans SY8 TaxID=477184 RepID=H0FAR6_9BURK|nr:putative baseplate assembly protein [Achromobacter arsenitoxydans]EHK64584.1 PA14 domain containing protein [Achromobacter arsenitoxydans SY8]
MTTPADCGCCAGQPALTPSDLANPPGQPALRLRIGTHGRFLASLTADLARSQALSALTTRDRDDPVLALFDAWAAVLDVLAFYQERIGNEGYLRTATERRSVQSLARAIGYELRPGVAATTWLAFTLETAPGAPLRARVEPWTRAQSVPAQDEQAQTFETLQALEARAAWNALQLAWREPVPPRFGARTLCLAGAATRLKPGDAVLIVGDERLRDPGNENWDFRRLTQVREFTPGPGEDGAPAYTLISLDRGLGSAAPHVQPAQRNPRCHALRAQARLFGHNAPDWRAMPATLRAAYLGMADDAKPAFSQFPQWPGFTLADVSDPPGTAAPGTGLYGEYYRGKAYGQRVMTRTDAQVDFHWAASGPGDGMPADNFSVRWTGWVLASVSGSHVFHVTADDGVRLWVDGDLLIDQWREQSPTEYSASVRLTAGRKHDIRIDYYEATGDATISLAWTVPGQARQAIPAASLYPADVHGVHLDAAYPKWMPGGWAVLSMPSYEELYRIADATPDAREGFALAGATTRLTLRGERVREQFNHALRETAAYGESEPLDWGARPASGLAQGHELVLDAYEPDLPEGRMLAVTGLVLAEDDAANAAPGARLLRGDPLASVRVARDRASADLEFEDGARVTVSLAEASDIVRIQRNDSAGGRTALLLDADLAHAYLPATVRINANVAPASHGDSRQMRIQPEVLGSGAGNRAFQRFTLQQKPLTFVPAPTASGAASTLELRVDGLLWNEAPRITALAPDERAYLLRLDDSGGATVQFGDGAHGARLPSGSGNVEARYRVGLGRQGNVAAGQLSVLLTRAPGVKAVVNPAAATGGTDPEAGDMARRNAPLRVRTLDRIVSLRDFEDYAAAFTGIGKAQAVWLWDGEQRLVHLTVAGEDGAALDPAGALYRNLLAAIDAARPPYQPLRVAPCRYLDFGLRAGLGIDARYEAPKVLQAAHARLLDAFGFAARAFGQPVHGAEALAVLQEVPGVLWVDLDALVFNAGLDGVAARRSSGPDATLPARSARWQQGSLQPAELLRPDPANLLLSERT